MAGLLVAASALVGACTSDDDAAPSHVPIPEAGLPTWQLGLHGPLAEDFDEAMWIERSSCLRDAGLPVAERGAYAMPLESRRYYYLPAGAARRHCYGLSSDELGAGEATYADNLEALLAGASDAERAAYESAHEACTDEAYVALCGDGGMDPGAGTYCRRALELDAGLEHDSFVAAGRAPAVEAAADEWRTCMADAGYDFDSVRDGWNVGADLEGDAAIAQATADMACKESSGYVATYRDAERREQLRMIAEDPERYARLAADREAFAERLASLLRDRQG